MECKICNLAGTQRTRITKHVNKAHNIEWDNVPMHVVIKMNEDIEAWVRSKFVLLLIFQLNIALNVWLL